MGGKDQMTKTTKTLEANVPIIGDSFESRKEQFVKEVNLIGEKYQIVLRAQLLFTREGIVPEYAYIDVKDKKQTPTKKDA